MKKFFLIPIALTTLFACKEKTAETMYTYPETRMDSTVVEDYFGTKVADPYRWLEDDNSDETKAWVDSQNVLTFNYLKAIPFRQNIIDRLTEIYNYERYSTPFKKAGKYFYFKNDGLQNQSVMYMQTALDAEATVLLDPNKLSDDGTVALSSLDVSKDGQFLAYSISRGGSDWNEIFVKHIASGELLKDHILWVKFSEITWYRDGFFYGRYPEPKEGGALSEANKNQKLYYHKLGTEQSADQLIYENPKFPERMYGASISDDENYLFLSESETTSGNGLYVKDLTKSNSKFVQIAEGFDFDFNIIEHIKGKFLILSNKGAEKYKLISVDAANPADSAQWLEILPESENVLQSVSVGGGKLIATYMQDAKSKVVLYDFDGKNPKEVVLPGIGSTGGISANLEDKIGFYSFSSYTVPTVIYKYDFESGKSEIYRKPVIKGLNFDDYTTEQVFYTSKDGTKVPMFITYKKGMKKDGTNPTLLYAYGGFNISLTPSFAISRMIWLEKGGVLAVANLRGGGEYGEAWHKAGTKMQKQNVFDDFIAAAEYLQNGKYTSKEKLAIQGGSNGGLLIGAVTNQRPDLFAVALPHVGVMDMLRYQEFTIGRAWSSDYGMSKDSKEMFDYLYKYSPVHTVKANTDYPAVMVLTADHDDRVVPAHSFKYAASMQEKTNGKKPAFIRIDKQAGHGAGKPTAKTIEENADIYAFIWQNMGVNPYKK